MSAPKLYLNPEIKQALDAGFAAQFGNVIVILPYGSRWANIHNVPSL